MHSDQSESDKDLSPMKQRPYLVSSDSELESYDDTLSRFGKEPASGKPFTKKGMSHKRMPKRIPQEHQGIV